MVSLVKSAQAHTSSDDIHAMNLRKIHAHVELNLGFNGKPLTFERKR